MALRLVYLVKHLLKIFHSKLPPYPRLEEYFVKATLFWETQLGLYPKTLINYLKKYFGKEYSHGLSSAFEEKLSVEA